ncbi:hypothetical protein JYU34_009509 [Plutella xylostella]|uniref:Uncharacterized protein n=1 Tax=Plutella xylostella TaxID=51655 RepID=A0ABQ7QJT9_PLUXY|nr:hypothetical protein JYU34_009509 [Plutella xylostella]
MNSGSGQRALVSEARRVADTPVNGFVGRVGSPNLSRRQNVLMLKTHSSTEKYNQLRSTTKIDKTKAVKATG